MKQSAPLAVELAEAARIVAKVAAGRSLADVMAAAHGALIDLTHGTLRRYGRVQAIVAHLSRRGAPDALVEALLWTALYALESGRYGEHTVVDEAVKACGLIEHWPAKGYVNGLLRSFLRQRSALEAQLGRDVEHDRDGPVVHECDLHTRPEDPARDADPLAFQALADSLVQRLGVLRRRGAREARPRSPGGIGDQRELAHDEHLALDVEDRAVEAPAPVSSYTPCAPHPELDACWM